MLLLRSRRVPAYDPCLLFKALAAQFIYLNRRTRQCHQQTYYTSSQMPVFYVCLGRSRARTSFQSLFFKLKNSLKSF